MQIAEQQGSRQKRQCSGVRYVHTIGGICFHISYLRFKTTLNRPSGTKTNCERAHAYCEVRERMCMPGRDSMCRAVSKAKRMFPSQLGNRNSLLVTLCRTKNSSIPTCHVPYTNPCLMPTLRYYTSSGIHQNNIYV